MNNGGGGGPPVNTLGAIRLYIYIYISALLIGTAQLLIGTAHESWRNVRMNSGGPTPKNLVCAQWTKMSCVIGSFSPKLSEGFRRPCADLVPLPSLVNCIDPWEQFHKACEASAAVCWSRPECCRSTGLQHILTESLHRSFWQKPVAPCDFCEGQTSIPHAVCLFCAEPDLTGKKTGRALWVCDVVLQIIGSLFTLLPMIQTFITAVTLHVCSLAQGIHSTAKKHL